MGSLQPEAEGSPAPEAAGVASFERSVTRRPTVSSRCVDISLKVGFGQEGYANNILGLKLGLKDKKSWSEPDLSALWCEKVWFKVVGGQL